LNNLNKTEKPVQVEAEAENNEAQEMKNTLNMEEDKEDGTKATGTEIPTVTQQENSIPLENNEKDMDIDPITTVTVTQLEEGIENDDNSTKVHTSNNARPNLKRTSQSLEKTRNQGKAEKKKGLIIYVIH
jgi:hypothetical protein